VKRTVLVYGVLGGALIAALKRIEYQFLVLEHSLEPLPVALVVALVSAGVLSRRRLDVVASTRQASP
jgi:hypothetical protein